MARKVRIEFSGACYHVINRGNYRRAVFGAKGAAAAFVCCLDETCRRFGWRMHGFVVMENHFHLAVETPDPNLSDGMKWLQGTWAMRFNRFHAETGRPFQGRYKAWHVEPGFALAQVVHYIHLNPYAAGIVPAGQIHAYAHGSLRLFATPNRAPWLEPSTALAESGGLPDTTEGWRRYGEYLLMLAEEGPRRREERFAALCRGWAIGSDTFVRQMHERLAKRETADANVILLGTDRAGQLQARHAAWEQKLKALANSARIDLSALPAAKSAGPKVFLAAAMKALTSVSNQWLAVRLQLGKTSSVAALLRQFRLSKRMQEPAFEAVLSRFMT